MLPSEFLEVQGYPDLKRLIEKQVDMQFVDLRALLRLPLLQEGLEGGCNFAAAVVLFNIIAGSSVCFYDANEKALVDGQARGQRFKEVLEKFYPWQGEQMSKDQCVPALYDSARNPLTHSLGLDAPPQGSTGKQVLLKKSPLAEAEVRELEESARRPLWLPPTIIKKSLASGATELTISILALYWGVHRMLHALFSEPSHATKAENLAKVFTPQWDIYIAVFDSRLGDDSVNVAKSCSTCGPNLFRVKVGKRSSVRNVAVDAVACYH